MGALATGGRLRERHKRLTRTEILDAVARLVLGGVDAGSLSMQAVADAAGVAHRTVYRHFKSRGELINAVGQHLDERFRRESGFDVEGPRTFEEYLASVEHMLTMGAAQAHVLRPLLIAALSMGEWRTDRDERIWRLFRQAYPHLDEQQARADFAVLRHILTAHSTILIGERFGIDLPSLIPAVERATRALADAIADRDRLAGERGAVE